MAAPSKTVLDRKKSADSVVAAARTHESRVAAALKAMFGDAAQGATITIMQATAKALEDHASAILRADEKHNPEVSDDKGARVARDETALLLRDKLLEDRQVLTGIAGEPYVAQLGFTGPTPDQPDTVLEFARVVEKRLGEVPAPESRLPGYTFDAAKWAKAYRPMNEKLDQAITKVRTEVREAEATLVDKNRALAEFDRVFSNAASLVSSLLAMGGEHELARRVRPSTRKVGLTAEVAEDPEVRVATPAPAALPA